MNGIENITARILREADEAAQAIEQRAINQAEEIRGSYDDLCKSARQEALDAAGEAAAEQALRGESAAALEQRKALLQEKQALIDQAFSAAGEQLRALPPERQVEFLSRLAAQAAQGNETVVLSPADRERIGPALVRQANERLRQLGKPGELTLSQETRDLQGGLVLQAGAVEQNFSFDVLLRSRREEMALEVSRLLFD